MTVEVKVNELKNTGELFPVTKNKPMFFTKKFQNLKDAKEWETKIQEKLKLLAKELQDES
jgi:hypothetical protein